MVGSVLASRPQPAALHLARLRVGVGVTVGVDVSVGVGVPDGVGVTVEVGVGRGGVVEVEEGVELEVLTLSAGMVAAFAEGVGIVTTWFVSTPNGSDEVDANN